MRCTRSHTTVWDIVAIDIIVVGCAYGRVAIVALSRTPVGSNSVNRMHAVGGADLGARLGDRLDARGGRPVRLRVARRPSDGAPFPARARLGEAFARCTVRYTAIGMMQQPCTGAQPQATKVEAEYR